MRGLGDISTKLDPGRGEEDATSNEDTLVDAPEVGLEFAGNADDDVEYLCKRSATTEVGLEFAGNADDDDVEYHCKRSATIHSSNFLRRTLSSSCRC